MKKLRLLIILLTAILPFVLTKSVFAGFGVSPAEIYNDSLKPGAKFEKEIILSRSDPDENLKVIIETDLHEAESWIKFEPGREFVFPKGETRISLKVTINVPDNAELKNYKGLLRIKAASMDSTNSGVSIVQGARMEVNLVTTSINVDILSIKGLNIPNVDFQQPIKLLVNIENNGNTEVTPSKIILEIQDLTQTTIETQEVTKLDKVSPNTTKEITAEFKNNLNSGEYFGLVKVYLNDKLLRSDRLVFKINAAPEGYVALTTKDANLFSRIFTFIKNNKVETIAFILIPLLPILIGYILFKKSKSTKLRVIFFIATLAYIIFIIILISLYHQKRLNDLAKPGDGGNVQGEMIEVTPTDIPKVSSQSPLIVNQDNTGYSVYRIPDLSSNIVYTAVENEKLNVVGEIEGWYQVLTSKGAGGWLPKSSVKKTQ